MPRITVTLAPDRISAGVEVTAGPAATAAELDATIAAAGVVHGLDAAAIAGMAARLGDPLFAGAANVARGTGARPGADGRLELQFASEPLPGLPREDGSMDWRERGLLHPAANGALVARVVPPSPGTAGRDVLGRELPPAPGKATVARTGAGVRRLGNGDIVAARDGVAVLLPGAVDVLPLYQHKGDVDLQTGNLHSAGSMLIAGDVTPGASVDARGDVVVQGAVLDAEVAADGSVLVTQSVQGTGARVTAGTDLHCRHGTSATLVAGGVLRVQDQLVNCRVRAGSIEVLGGRGAVVGGELRARTAVRVQQAGTPSESDTLISVGDLLDDAPTEAPAEVPNEVPVEAPVEVPVEMRGGPPQGLARVRRARPSEADPARMRQLELARRQRELLKTASVEVLGTVFAGVRIRFGAAVWCVQEPRSKVRFRWDETRGAIAMDDV